MGLLGVRKFRLQAGMGEVTYSQNGIFLSPESALALVHRPPHTASLSCHTGSLHPHLCPLSPPSGAWSPLDGLGTWEAHQAQTHPDKWLAPRLAVV